MINFDHIEKYKESNRLEVKKATGGLPDSIWETYSAFANTSGGIILLGVGEKSDKSFEIIGLTDCDEIIKKFWDIINNRQKVSINILSDKNIYMENVNGKSIIVINIPRADRSYRPVYINNNPLNSYRRNGEGDYKCTKEEYQAMVRDSSVKTPDMTVLEEMDLTVFNIESLHGYRQRMKYSRPGHVWEQLEDDIFLQKIGAVSIGSDGKKHPTSAGLLMFGNEYDIVREFNNYFLDYQEQYDIDNRWTDRLVSSSGDWSGNVYDFYFRVYNKLQSDIKTPFKLNGIIRIEDTPIHIALREALANCLVNADYYGRRGIKIVKKQNFVIMENPGNSRVELDIVKSGGVSDPRNSTMLKMFNFIDIGERAGSGIPNIFRVWNEQGLREPEIYENYNPDRYYLKLPLIENVSDKKQAIKTSDKKQAIKTGDKIILSKQEKIVVDYMKNNSFVKTSDISDLLEISPSRARAILSQLLSKNLIIAEGTGNKNRTYKINNN